MNASFNAQVDKSKNKYTLRFETDNYELYKKVERICQKAVDKAGKATAKARVAQASLFGHWFHWFGKEEQNDG